MENVFLTNKKKKGWYINHPKILKYRAHARNINKHNPIDTMDPQK